MPEWAYDPVPMHDKPQLRRLAKLLSGATPSESTHVVGRLRPLIPEGVVVCVYLPMAGEVDMTGLLNARPDCSYVTTRTGDDLWLTVHPIDAPRERHPFGYEQPRMMAPRRPIAEISVFVVPGLAFDEQGNRLGHGVGYYDRLLSQAPASTLLVGTALERRIFPEIPTDEHDVAMDVLVTESRVIRP